MSDKAERLKAELASLSLEDLDGIREYLDDLAEPELTQEEWEESWSEEINRRIADDEAGLTEMIPGQEVMRRLREKYS